MTKTFYELARIVGEFGEICTAKIPTDKTESRFESVEIKGKIT